MWGFKAIGNLTKRDNKVYIAKVPPSPSSSAERTMMMYLMVTIKVSDQIIKDSTPSRSSRLGGALNVDEYT